MPKKKVSSFKIAAEIAKEFGDFVTDEILTTVANKNNMYPKVLIKNYREVINIRRKIYETIS